MPSIIKKQRRERQEGYDQSRVSRMQAFYTNNHPDVLRKLRLQNHTVEEVTAANELYHKAAKQGLFEMERRKYPNEKGRLILAKNRIEKEEVTGGTVLLMKQRLEKVHIDKVVHDAGKTKTTIDSFPWAYLHSLENRKARGALGEMGKYDLDVLKREATHVLKVERPGIFMPSEGYTPAESTEQRVRQGSGGEGKESGLLDILTDFVIEIFSDRASG